MMRRTLVPLCAVVLALALSAAAQAASPSVVATGLSNPRNLRFGPDGALYVAEGGVGGSHSTAGPPPQCPQVPPPVGPYTGAPTGARISRIEGGVRRDFATGFPSSMNVPGFVSGVADVAFLGGRTYALVDGAGCSHGVPERPNEVVRVGADGSFTPLADLSAFWMLHPVARPDPGDFEPDGTPYAMVAWRGALYVTEPNHGEIDRVSPHSGKVTRLVDLSASLGHVVPTALLAAPGGLLVGNLGTFPVMPGTEHLWQVSPGGQVIERLTGLTAVLGLASGEEGSLYVLETATQGPAPFTGDLVRIDRSGARRVVASGLAFPTGLVRGPDEALYVSEFGFGFPPGAGRVVRIVDEGEED